MCRLSCIVKQRRVDGAPCQQPSIQIFSLSTRRNPIGPKATEFLSARLRGTARLACLTWNLAAGFGSTSAEAKNGSQAALSDAIPVANGAKQHQPLKSAQPKRKRQPIWAGARIVKGFGNNREAPRRN